jgi:hypothetical protein
MVPPEVSGALQRNFDALRCAMQERRYPDAQRLLSEQRGLLAILDIEDREACDLFHTAQELTNWALTLARVQHAHTERAFISLLKLKQLDAGYLPSPVCSAELVSVRG